MVAAFSIRLGRSRASTAYLAIPLCPRPHPAHRRRQRRFDQRADTPAAHSRPNKGARAMKRFWIAALNGPRECKARSRPRPSAGNLSLTLSSAAPVKSRHQPEELLVAVTPPVSTYVVRHTTLHVELRCRSGSTANRKSSSTRRDGFSILVSISTVTAKIPGSTRSAVPVIAAKAKAGCPVSKLRKLENCFDPRLLA